ESGGTGAVVQGIASQAFDIGIAASTVADPLIHAEPLFETTIVLALPSSHPLAERSVFSIHDLDGQRMVALPENSQFGAVINRALRREKIAPLIIGRARTHSALCRMVGSGAGMALVDDTIASHYTTPEVVFREIGPAITRTVCTMVNARTAPSIATRSLLETLHGNAKRIAGTPSVQPVRKTA
ncbi:MAG: LysR family transcriptional regulator substrate-binding protein, partial [Alphaproteobacteria bacterium]